MTASNADRFTTPNTKEHAMDADQRAAHDLRREAQSYEAAARRRASDPDMLPAI